MSWMDSWSRPGKSQATPAPFYLLPGGDETPYCKSCGRIISQRKSKATKSTNTPAKYCSDRCRHHRPGKLDREIEGKFVELLSGAQQGKTGKRRQKGDPRVIVDCSEVEIAVFGDRADPEKTFGRKRDRKARGVPELQESEGIDLRDEEQLGKNPTEGYGDGELQHIMESTSSEEAREVVDGDILARLSVRSGTRIRPSQGVSEVNGSVGGEKGWAERTEETEEMLEKRTQGQKRVAEKEMVKNAARRGVVFGFIVNEETQERRKCEAVMLGKVVEPSFAKGDWGVRWRED